MADRREENIQAAATTWEDLPETVIEHIQSFLPVKEAIRSCLISKSCLHVIPTSPDLILGLQYLDPEAMLSEYSVYQIMKLWRDIVKFIDETMARYRKHNLPINRFDLNLVFDLKESASVAPLLDDWLRVATSSSSPAGGLKHLSVQAHCLKAYSKKFSIPSRLPQSAVRLRGCDMVNLSSLVTLFLRHIHFDDEEAVAKLFSNCPLLEKIRIIRCSGDALQRVRVSKVPRLRELQLSYVCNEVLTVVDDALALVSLTYVGALHHPPVVLDLKAARYLKSLTLEISHISRILSDNVISELPVLEDLSIHYRQIPPTPSIELASDSLKRLTIGHSCGYLTIALNAPKLLLLSYYGRIVPTLHSPSNTWMKLKIRLHIDQLDSSYNSHFSRLGKLVSETSQSDISICISTARVFMSESSKAEYCDFLRRPSAASPIKNVWFTSVVCEEWRFSIILDGLLSVCRPQFTCMKCSRDNVPFMGFLLTNLMGGRHTCCCTSDHQIKCWGHYLKMGSEIEFRSEACTDDEEGWQPLPFHWRDLIEGPADKREGYDIRIRLSWSEHPL